MPDFEPAQERLESIFDWSLQAEGAFDWARDIQISMH